MTADFDDYLIHQCSTPVAQPAVTDRNFYDRHWCNGFDQGGEFEEGAPSKLSTSPGVFFVWMALLFGDFNTH